MDWINFMFYKYNDDIQSRRRWLHFFALLMSPAFPDDDNIHGGDVDGKTPPVHKTGDV